jgi:CHASE3 domain sensor protein
VTPGQTRNFADAVAALREAETLVNLAAVSGPADEPPHTDSDEQSWVSDWVERAKTSAHKAAEWAASPVVAMKDRARRVVDRLREGARRVHQATFGRAAKALKPVQDAINTVQFGMAGASLIVTAGMLYLAYRFWFKRT